jgi:hypothetical protein
MPRSQKKLFGRKYKIHLKVFHYKQQIERERNALGYRVGGLEHNKTDTDPLTCLSCHAPNFLSGTYEPHT